MSKNSTPPTIVDWLFRALGIIAIALISVLLYDLFVLGQEPYNPVISAFPIRIMLGVIAGGFGVLISNLILWKVPGNPIGRLLLLWTIGGIGWQFSYNFGSTEVDQLAFFTFIYVFGALAITSVVLLLFYFPTGRVYPPSFAPFVPIFIAVQVIGTILVVTSMDPALYKFDANPFRIAALDAYSGTIAALIGHNGGIVSVLGLLLGCYALISRYRQVGLVERQQIKWLAWAGVIMTGFLIGFLGVHLLVYQSFSVVPIIDYPFFIIATTVPSLAVGAAVLRYGLWDINFIISRTVLYISLSTILAIVFAASATIINKIAQQLFESDTGVTAALLSTILIIAIFQPVRRYVDDWINERYFPENRELKRDFVEFASEYRSVITEQEMLSLITQRISGLLNASCGCIFLHQNDNRFKASTGWNLDLDQVGDQKLIAGMLTSWGAAKAVRNSEGKFFAVFAPLYVPRIQEDEIIGLIGLGYRKRDQGYSRNDLRELTRFGEEAGKVIYSYKLRAKKSKT